MALSESERKRVRDDIAAAKRFMLPRAEKHVACCRRYLDPSGEAPMRHDGGARQAPEGQLNWMATNIRQKLAVLSYNHPDHVVTASRPENAAITRTFLRDAWRQGNWRRLVAQSGLDMMISGLGFLSYAWTSEGFVAEYLNPGDMYIDPHTTDSTWGRLRAGGYRIRMPLADAEARYGKAVAKSAVVGEPLDYDTAVRNTTWDAPYCAVDMWWTQDEEYELIGDTIVKRENLYNAVPILVLQGNIDPRSVFAAGDYDEALGGAEMLRQLLRVLSFAGRHGNGVPWVRADMIDGDIREQVLDNTYDGVVPIIAGTGSDVFGYTAVQPLNPALMEAIRMVSAGVDADQAVDQYSRGAVTRPADFATQAALEVSAGGARAAAVRAQFETFCEDLSRRCVEVTRRFMLDPRMGDPKPEEKVLWEALLDTDDVRIVDESMEWREPGQELAQASQTLQITLAAMPTFMELANAGMIDSVPNLPQLYEDVLRASRKRQIDQYFIPLPQAAAGPGGTEAPPNGTPPDPGPAPGGAPQERVEMGPGIGGLVPPNALEETLNNGQ